MPRKQRRGYPPVDEYGFHQRPSTYWSESENLSRMYRDEKTMVTTGNWVLITKSILVEHAPQVYGIYWAVPFLRKGRAGIKDEKTGLYTDQTEIKDLTGVDEYGRQCALIYTPHEVRIFPDEYAILSEEKVQTYRDMGWALQQTGVKPEHRKPLDMELIQKGRSLTEEEREIIWAFQLDGLNEHQACEEYFLTHHTETDNTSICYLPIPEVLSDILAVFGER